jgi:CubicO group peptidase (beta-lactamase class C family)
MTDISRRVALRFGCAFTGAAIISSGGKAQAQLQGWRPPPDNEIARLIAERNAQRPGQGIVIGVLEPEGQRIVAGGTGAGAKVNGDTLFEIGSITKVFTAMTLADMANKGEVSLDDPAAKYLPPGHRMPERNGRQITLRDLSTHRSGLPRMPDGMRPMTDPDGPFADYTEDKLLAFLDRYQLTRDIGSQWEYSNLGAGLLGDLLSRAAGVGFEALVRTRICAPLGMNSTMINLPPGARARVAPPHDSFMRPATQWTFDALAGAGAIYSSASDMLLFAKAVLDPNSPIAAAVKTMLSVRVPSDNPRLEQALGWMFRRAPGGGEILMHDGETWGYRAMLALQPSAGRAVVGLANSRADPPPADLALHILAGAPVQPTAPLPTVHTEIALPAEALEKFVGRYDFGPGFTVAVTRDGRSLYALRESIAGASPLQIFPEAPLAFFWKTMDAQVRFFADAGGAVTGAEISQSGRTFFGRRIGQ